MVGSWHISALNRVFHSNSGLLTMYFHGQGQSLFSEHFTGPVSWWAVDPQLINSVVSISLVPWVTHMNFLDSWSVRHLCIYIVFSELYFICTWVFDFNTGLLYALAGLWWVVGLFLLSGEYFTPTLCYWVLYLQVDVGVCVFGFHLLFRVFHSSTGLCISFQFDGELWSLSLSL